MDAATKKLFAVVNSLEQKLTRLDDLEKKLTALDTNGRLDYVREEMEKIRKEMVKVAANSRIVVTTVESQGTTIENLEKVIRRINIRCPLLKPTTDEFQSITAVSEREKLKDE
jgi:hypothetical protein